MLADEAPHFCHVGPTEHAAALAEALCARVRAPFEPLLADCHRGAAERAAPPGKEATDSPPDMALSKELLALWKRYPHLRMFRDYLGWTWAAACARPEGPLRAGRSQARSGLRRGALLSSSRHHPYLHPMAEQPPRVTGAPGSDPRRMEVRRPVAELGARAYAIQLLADAGVPFLVGGAYAFAHYTGIYRDTKDLDLFLLKEGADRGLEVLAQNGWRVERNVHGWLHKAFWDDFLVDLIFASGNGITGVDEAWFTHAHPAALLGCECLVPPAEEIFWSKAFVLERERFDGHDLTHLLLKAGPHFDWPRLLRRFERYWEVLLSHLMLFRFCYPSERDIVPGWVLRELLSRADRSVDEGAWAQKLCRGRILSQVSYEVDLDEWGYQDGRRWDEQQRQRQPPPPADEEGPALH